jgi:RNA polymerase sigma-70 factor (ECF subfamily)
LARNAAIDAGRDVARRRNRMRTFSAEAPLTSRATPDGDLTNHEGHRDVLDAVQALPALYREPFVLRHLSGWSYREIAAAMGMPVDSVETRLVRARRLLRDCLKDKVF